MVWSLAIFKSGDRVYLSSLSWLEEVEEWDGEVNDRLYEVGLLCDWVFSIHNHELEDQSLEVKEEGASKLCLKNLLHDNSYWWIVLERSRRLKFTSGDWRFIWMWFDFFFNCFRLFLTVNLFFCRFLLDVFDECCIFRIVFIIVGGSCKEIVIDSL